MKKIAVLIILISIILTACNLSNNSGNDDQIVSMQKTIDAMQQSQGNAPASEPQANSPAQAQPTQKPPTQQPPTVTLTPAKPSLKKLPTNTSAPIVPIIPFTSKVLLLEFDNPSPMIDTCNSGRQDMNPFGGDLWREADQLFAFGLNCSIRFEMYVPQTKTYKITLYATYAPDFADLKVYVGSTNNNTGKVTDVSLYGPTVKPTGPIDLGSQTLSTDGIYFINFLVSGKSSFSSDYKFGIDYLTWEPTN